jgi:hypothetical protein
LREAADDLDLELLVNVLGGLVVAQQVRGQGQGELGGAAAGVPPPPARPGRDRRTATQTGGGAPPDARATIWVDLLAELARWRRQRDALTGGAARVTAPQHRLPPAPTDSRTPASTPSAGTFPLWAHQPPANGS